MNRRELVSAVATHTGVDSRDVDKVLRGATEVIEAVAAKGEQVTISGFAKFARVDRPARMARNPGTGEPVKVRASKKARITPLKGFKDAVMRPMAAPKLAKGVWPPVPAKASPGAGSARRAGPARAVTSRAPARSSPASKAGASKAAATKPAPPGPPAKRAGAAKAAPAAKKPASGPRYVSRLPSRQGGPSPS